MIRQNILNWNAVLDFEESIFGQQIGTRVFLKKEKGFSSCIKNINEFEDILENLSDQKLYFY